ncbi:MAG: YiiG family protein [Verrucomicrobiota bacterium]|nr:YiiG family protein [Verrucomicrobiota bacterium]
MKSLPRLVVAAVLLAASAAGHAQTIADLPDDKFRSVVEKAALYAKALSAARTVQKSYDRYAAWVDIKIGPTGKERSIDGVPGIGALQEITDAATKGPGMWPPLGGVDGMAQKLGQATTALAPLIKSASDYYTQRQYKNDGAKRGQELHGQMLPLFEQFFAAELAMRREFSAVFEDIERRYLAQIEKEHGKNYEWHLRSFLLAAKTLTDLLPNHADAAMIEGARFKARFANLQAAYTLFTHYCVEHPAEVQKAVLSTSLEDFFAATRILRGILDAPKPDRQVYLAKVNDLAAKYEALVQRTTMTAAR